MEAHGETRRARVRIHGWEGRTIAQSEEARDNENGDGDGKAGRTVGLHSRALRSQRTRIVGVHVLKCEFFSLPPLSFLPPHPLSRDSFHFLSLHARPF